MTTNLNMFGLLMEHKIRSHMDCYPITQYMLWSPRTKFAKHIQHPDNFTNSHCLIFRLTWSSNKILLLFINNSCLGLMIFSSTFTNKDVNLNMFHSLMKDRTRSYVKCVQLSQYWLVAEDDLNPSSLAYTMLYSYI